MFQTGLFIILESEVILRSVLLQFVHVFADTIWAVSQGWKCQGNHRKKGLGTG